MIAVLETEEAINGELGVVKKVTDSKPTAVTNFIENKMIDTEPTDLDELLDDRRY
jgi:hypothetical protein